MNQINQIVSDINNGVVKPIYFLMGEESYYIDKISDFIEENILKEEEKGFNQTVMYGRDVSVEDIIGAAKRFPMMAEKQVIIVKEAQDLSRTIEKLASYASNPQPSTVLVINYKYKKLDRRKALFKAIHKIGLVFESKRLYDNQVADWIRRVLGGKNYQVEPKAAQMLVDFLGTDLSKINNELEKLITIFPQNTIITPDHIEDNIGISKDFNNFELRKAVGEKNITKANQIIQYFAQNPKSNPLVMTISLLNSFSAVEVVCVPFSKGSFSLILNFLFACSFGSTFFFTYLRPFCSPNRSFLPTRRRCLLLLLGLLFLLF